MISILKKIRSIYVLITLVVILVATVVRFSPWQNAGKSGKLISWDVTSYYGYLPAQFIHHDLKLNFVARDSSYYHEHQMFWPERTPNGGYVIKTTMGLSILYSPFFFIANGLDEDQGKNRGFSQTFEFWLTLSSLFFTILGAIFLRLFLLKHYSDTHVSLTLMIMYLGTNLFYYITIEPLMPHAYSFFLISTFLYLTHKWFDKKTLITTIFLGLTYGMIVLIRPVNGIVLLFFILYNLEGFSDIKNRLHLLGQHIPKIVIFSLTTFLVFLPQLIYWQQITGDFIFNSYPNERFYFGNPHILDGLFSYRKGWLLYTPMMFFGLIGIFLNSKNRISSIAVVIPSLYVMFSWWNWWYGGSFGCRPVIDFYPILSIGIANFIQFALDSRSLRYSLLSITGLLMVFNLFQTLQKKSDAIHWEAMTKEAYWHNFLHRYPQPGFESTLRHPDINAALEGKEEY
ncbi:MAG: hypothetical protein H6598_07720 [Flavobacteriales bacterium]|nr:hypothetical protein [Flavobacteriales bacterium]